MMPVSGQLEVRCAYGAPWRVTYERSEPGEMPYHVIVGGSAVLESPDGATQRLEAGDIVLLTHGSQHALHDGSGARPSPGRKREIFNVDVSENRGKGERLDMLCGRFVLTPPHDRLMRNYLPAILVVRSSTHDEDASRQNATSLQLASLVGLMRAESASYTLGGHAMLNALSAALFALTLRMASESEAADIGLLALAGHPRLAPALSAMFNEPARAWTLPELAQRCNMSRATLVRHFRDKVGCSVNDLLTDIRMTLAANELKKPATSTEAVAEVVGYQSLAAFRRAFTQRMGMTPGEWRRAAQDT